jgi:drug/metabolite transporter (DMT)-like permease
MSRLLANTLLLLAALFWGSAFVAQATAMAHLGPLTFTGVRFLIAAAAVLPFALAEGRRNPGNPLTAGMGLRFTGLGLVFFAAITLQQVGLLTTTVTNAGFLTGIYVVLTPLLALVVFREKPHAVAWPASLVTLGGIWLLSGGDLKALGTGDMLMIVCAVFWALHVGLIGGLAATSGRPLALSCWQFAVVGTAALAPGLLLEPVTLAALWAAAPELFYTSLISGGLAFTLQAIGQRWTRAADAAILLSSEALFAALFGALLLGERLDAAGLAGCLLIFLAIIAVQLVPMISWNRWRLRPNRV